MSRHLRRALPSSISSLLALSLIGPSSLEAYPITAVDLVAGLEGTEAADVLPVTVSVAAPAVASAEQLDFVALLGGGDVDASSTALARSAGVDGRAGDDTVTVVPPAGVTGTATAQAKGALVGGSLLGSAAVNVGVDATAVATGLDGGADADRVSAATTGTTADARARGVSLALAVDGTLAGSDATAGSAVVQAATQSAAQAVALQGGAGGDTLLGNGSLSATAGAHTTAVAAGISVGVGVGGDVAAAAGLSDASGRAEASATGLAGGEGADTLRTEGGRVDLSADAGTAAVGVSLGISGSVSGDAATAPPVSRSGATAAARVTGLSGGAGDDVVVSGQPVTGSARSDATAVGVSVGVTVAKGGTVSGGALSNAAVTALSGATGIDGGDGNDVLGGTGALTLTARSDATAVGVGVAIAGTVAVGGTADGGVAGTALSDSQATAEASAVGVEGGGGADTIDNGGVITAGAVAHATAVAVTVAGDVNVGIDVTPDGDVSGAALSDARVGSAAATTGIAGGAEGDGITNRGALSLTSEARSTGVAVGLTLAGNVAYKPPADEGAAPPAGDEDDDSAPKVGGRALGNAATTAQATTRGLAGEAGDDTLLDVATGTLRLLHATADAVGVAASVNLSAGVGVGTDAKIDVSGAAVSDVRVTAEAVAAALEGGAGKDTVTNQAEVTDLRADATATGVAAALTISGSLAYKGDASGKLAGEAMSKASTLAAARAVVLGGGSGDDVLLNEAVLRSVVAHADATGVSAALGVTAGLAIDGSAKDVEVSGRAVGDVGVAATATAIGLDGGTGRDTITNRGSIPALLAESEATGVSVAVNIAGTLAYKGEADSAVAGEAVSTSTASADSLALGIAAGDGGGDILNTASLGSVRATATTTSVGVGLAISGQVAYAEKKDDGTGEDDGASGEDAAAGDGKEIKGRVVSDARALATALAGGIGGGEGVDVVDNRGAIAASAVADATAVAVSVAGSVNVGIDVAPKGDVSGAALSDARVQGTATAVGIDGAGAADGITNSAALSVKSDAKATGVAVGLTIAGNVSYEKGEDGAGDGATPESSDEDEGAGKVSGDALSRASTTAIATTAGILGGDGNDTIVNEIAGVLPLLDAANALARATGVAATLNLAAGVAVGSDAKLDVTGAAVSDVSVRADALATAIDGGAGNDAITNRAALARLWADATATGVAAALNVSGSLAYEGAVSGKLAGEAVSDAQTLATARTVAFGGADGDDTVTNEAALGEIKATSRAVGVAAALGVSAGLAIKGDAKDVEVSGRAVSDASVTASATAIAIEGGAGGDTLDNEGAIAAVLAESHATGVAASLNVAGSLSYKGDTDANVAGQAVSDTSVTSAARAAAMTGGDGADHLTNGATLSSVVSRADAVGVAATLGVAVSVTVEGDATAKVDGGALSKGTVTADAATTGLDGGAGDDVIVNTGAMPWLESAADTVGVAAGLGVSAVVTVKGDTTADVTGNTLSDTSARAQATTTALSGGDGVDRIESSGALNLLAGADATGIAASLNVSAAVTFKGTQEADVGGNAASNASVTALATATGIDGGAGNDTLVNDGAITVMRGADVDAYALGVAAALNVSGSLTIKGVSTGGDVAGTAASDARVAAQALATGIDGGDGADDITNRAPVVLLPAAEALGVSGSLNVSFNLTGESSGGAFSVADVTALAGATGVAGGAGDDVVSNAGRLELMKQALGESPIDAKALAVSVSLNLSGTLNGDAKGKAIATATTTADAAAVGIDGGSGADRLTNSGAIVADVGAEADAVSVAASITVTGATGGHSEGAALTDARALARAAATGIHGGDGGDTLVNTGALDLTSGADAAATAVSVNLSGGLVGKATGTALADGSAHAASRSVGVDGGAGADGIASSLQPVTVHALSSADSQSVAVSIAGAIGLAHGAAVADASASSDAYAAALDGGAGADTIDNASVLAATAGAVAIAKSTSVGVTFGVGTAENVGTGNSSATARATATGIEGGDDGDTITNRAAITVGGAGALPMANATSGSTTVGVTVALGTSKGSMSSDSAARALAGAYGISGGAGADHIDNSGAITAGRKPPDDLSSLMARATAGSDTVNVALGAGGSFQDAAANASALAATTVAGLAGGAGVDTIDNRGAIEAYASAGAFSGGAATKASLTLGTSGGGASSDASSVSTAFAAGIDSGADADEVHLMGNLTVGSWSLSSASSTARDYNILSIGAALQSALADSSSSATAVAQGIYGGTGRDLLSLGDPLAAGAYRIDVDALSSVASTSRASSVAGLTGGSVEQQARSAAETVSHALAVGVDGGEGNDGIVGAAKITADATAGASTTGVSSTNTGVSIGGANRGESMSDARATVTAEGVGIRGGVAALAAGETDRDTIVNAAPVAVTATASGSSESTATAKGPVTIAGSAAGRAVADASAEVLARAVGVDGGADDDVIETRAGPSVSGTIDATANASTTVKATSRANEAVAFGAASSMGVSDASASVATLAVGIDAGAGDDVVRTRTRVATTSEASGNITATSDVTAHVAFGAGSTGAVSDSSASKRSIAVGIDAGSGADLVENTGEITGSAVSGGTVASSSSARTGAFFGRAASNAVSSASLEGATDATGVRGGEGGDTLRNYGTVRATADSTLTVTSLSVATAKSTFSGASAATDAAADAVGSAVSLGIGGDGGNDVVENAGVLDATGSATTSIRLASIAIAKSTFGSASTLATSRSVGAASVSASGIAGGDGDDNVTVADTGRVTVKADADLTLTQLTVSSAGPAYADARARAIAVALGVEGGDGADRLVNLGDVQVYALPRVLAATRSAGGYVEGDVGVRLDADARGLDGGAGDDLITNAGDVTVL
ncbi:MAG: hypothetical protein MUE39_01070, partial [Gammaproteobacteria bacterium]|nr:hypothetical protein [Gammaproteobacteria bacterium]